MTLAFWRWKLIFLKRSIRPHFWIIAAWPTQCSFHLAAIANWKSWKSVEECIFKCHLYVFSCIVLVKFQFLIMCFILCEHHRQVVLDVLDSEGFSLNDVDEDFEQQIVRRLYHGDQKKVCCVQHVDFLTTWFDCSHFLRRTESTSGQWDRNFIREMVVDAVNTWLSKATPETRSALMKWGEAGLNNQSLWS